MALKPRATKKPKLSEDPKVREAAAFVGRGLAARGAVDQTVARPTPAIRRGPSKTQIGDAIRGVAPGLPAATVSRIAAVVMDLYGG